MARSLKKANLICKKDREITCSSKTDSQIYFQDMDLKLLKRGIYKYLDDIILL